MGSFVGELVIRTWAGVLHAFWESTLGNERSLFKMPLLGSGTWFSLFAIFCSQPCINKP